MDGQDRKERDELICSLRRMQVEIADIAARVSLSPRQVQRILHREGLTSGKYNAPHTQEFWDRIEKFLREEDAPYKVAAEIFGSTEKHIAARFPDLGWTRQQAQAHAAAISGINRRTRLSNLRVS